MNDGGAFQSLYHMSIISLSRTSFVTRAFILATAGVYP